MRATTPYHPPLAKRVFSGIDGRNSPHRPGRAALTAGVEPGLFAEARPHLPMTPSLPEIIAHRGSSAKAPENTAAAVRQAWQENADAVEVDVHISKDGAPVVLHDADTLRTTGIRGLVSKLTAAELRQLDAGSWKNPVFAGEKIPLLEEILAIGPPHRRFFVEIKTGPETVPTLARCVAASGLSPRQVVLIAFDLETVTAAKHSLPEHAALWIVPRQRFSRSSVPIETILSRAQAAGADGLDLAHQWPLDRTRVGQIRSEGLSVWAWTVDTAPLARRLCAAGVDGITTNRPGWLRTQLAPPAPR